MSSNNIDLSCSGYSCGYKIKFNSGEWKIQSVLGRSYKKSILEIENSGSCRATLLTRKQVIQLRDFLSDLIAQTYIEHYFDELED